MPTLLQSQQNKAVENKYHKNILFRLLHFICAPILAEQRVYEVHCGELFYNCLYSLDCLKGSDEKERVEYAIMLWHDLVNYCAEKGWNMLHEDAQKAVCMIAYSIVRVLIVCHDPRFTYPASLINGNVQKSNPSYYRTLHLRYNKAIQTIGEDKLTDYLQAYMCSPVLLSDELDAIIEANENVSTQQSRNKRGKPVKPLFVNAQQKIDEERMNIEKERFLEYLRAHKLGQERLSSNKNAIIMKIIVSFWYHWKQHGYVSESPNGMAIYRFLHDTCEIKSDVTDKSFANCIRSMISDKYIDKSKDIEIKYLFLEKNN